MKYSKRKFQTILSSDKINFRGHQKALMRIMDGTSRKLDCRQIKEQKAKEQKYRPEEPDDQNAKIRQQRSIRQQEEELRLYEEKVFVENIVSGVTRASRLAFSKEYQDVRQRYEQEVCPFYNGGEKRVADTELNVNPYFEKMANRLLKQPVHDIEDLNALGRQQ